MFLFISVTYLILKKPVENYLKKRKENAEKRNKLMKQKVKELEEIEVGDKEFEKEQIEDEIKE